MCVVLRFVFVDMVDVKKQRVCIRFCFKSGKSAAETHKMFKQSFGDVALSQTNWFKRLRNGLTSLDDDKRLRRSSTSTTPKNAGKMREGILEDSRRTIHDTRIFNIVLLSYGPCQRILSGELTMRWFATEFVPSLLINDQKQHRLEVSMEFQDQVRIDQDFLSKFVTTDKSWVYVYDLETKQQSSQWKYPSSSRLKKARKVKSNVK